jgi:hypothetical protein
VRSRTAHLNLSWRLAPFAPLVVVVLRPQGIDFLQTMTGCELIRDRGDLRHFQRLFSSFDPDAKQEINIVTFFEEIYLLMTKNKVCDG